MKIFEITRNFVSRKLIHMNRKKLFVSSNTTIIKKLDFRRFYLNISRNFLKFIIYTEFGFMSFNFLHAK